MSGSQTPTLLSGTVDGSVRGPGLPVDRSGRVQWVLLGSINCQDSLLDGRHLEVVAILVIVRIFRHGLCEDIQLRRNEGCTVICIGIRGLG